MRQRSSVTLQPLPTLKEAVGILLNAYMSDQGYAEFYDLTKVIYSEKHEDIVKELIYQAEGINHEAMISEGLCPECGSRLIYKRSLFRLDCSNAECALSYNVEVAS